MHIMIQIADHVELYYTVWQIKKDSVGKIFFLFPNTQPCHAHALKQDFFFFFFFFLVLLQPVQRANDSVLDPHRTVPCV